MRRGNDPRLLVTLIGRMILYRPWAEEPSDLNTNYDRELLERNFRLAPRCKAADFAWKAYAAYLQQGGQAEAARVWRARAREAARTSVFLMPRLHPPFSRNLRFHVSSAPEPMLSLHAASSSNPQASLGGDRLPCKLSGRRLGVCATGGRRRGRLRCPERSEP